VSSAGAHLAPVLGREPRVQHLGDIDTTVSKNQRASPLLAAVTPVALDTNNEEPFFMHLITIRRLTRSSYGEGIMPSTSRHRC
jgi:hypothetical protein